jgi:uncharacterized protein YbaP (TraB family)
VIARILLIAALLMAAPVEAQRAGAAPAQPLAPLMWEIRRGEARVTLFGTVHALPRGVAWFRPHLVEALDSADVLVLETRLPDGPVLAPETLRLGRLAAPRPVLERVPPEWQARLNAEVMRLKPPPLEWMKTWYVALTLLNLDAERRGLSPAIGAEAVLTERARLRNIKVDALETLEEQLGFFDSLSEADQQQLLIGVIESMRDAEARTQQIISHWIGGRNDQLGELMDAEFRRSPMLEQLLLRDRNARWAAWIERQLKTPGHRFVAVGAGHMAGRHSLLAMLAARGIEAQPAMPPPARRARRR